MTDTDPIIDESADTETILRDLFAMVESAKSMPMSTSVRVEREETLDLIEAAVQRLPDELRAARWLLKERDEFRARTRREADEVIATATEHAGAMVARQEVVRIAEQRGEHILDDAEAEARRMMREAEDYCDQKLAGFEVILEKLQKTVAAGRRRLAATVEESELREAEDHAMNEFFVHDGEEPQLP